MSQAIAGFIDYDANGKPFMGLLLQDGGTQVHFFLARREDSMQRAKVIGEQLMKLARELQGTKDRIIAVEGSIDAFVPPSIQKQRRKAN